MDSNSNHPAEAAGDSSIITAATLRELGACERGVRAFRRRWPAGATLAQVIREPWRSPQRGAYLIWYVSTLAARQEPLPPCDPAALAELARDPDPRAREAAVRHPACPPAELARATRDADWRVRAAVVCHPACPPEALAHAVLRDPVQLVRWWAVQHNPACPPDVLAHVAEHAPDEALREEAARRLAAVA